MGIRPFGPGTLDDLPLVGQAAMTDLLAAAVSFDDHDDAPVLLRCQIVETGQTLVLRGDLDLSDRQALVDAGRIFTDRCIAEHARTTSAGCTDGRPVQDAVVDAAGLGFIDAAGIGVLVAMSADLGRAGVRLRTVHAGAQLRRLSAICGLDTVLGLQPLDAPGAPLAEGAPDVMTASERGVPGGHTPDGHRLPLVASPDPSVVFASLAAGCVPQLCDSCSIEIVADGGSRHIVHPPALIPAGGLLRIVESAARTANQVVRVPFTYPQQPDAETPSERDDGRGSAMVSGGFSGQATFVWHYRPPAYSDRVAVFALVDRVVRTVAWQRSEQVACQARSDAETLRSGLQTSRRIGTAVGILMAQFKITNDQAFELLSRASQHCNRKVRDLAHDVIDTGWLDPNIITATTGGRSPAR